MGHAGAIVSGKGESAAEKVELITRSRNTYHPKSFGNGK